MTLVVLHTSAIVDMNGNNVTEIPSSRPRITPWMSPAPSWWTLTLETMSFPSLNTTFVLIENAEDVTSSHAIDTSDEDDKVVPIRLSRIDSNEIKRLTDVATFAA